jgi:hypothetical protein
MSSFFDEASLVMIPSGYKDQKVYSVKPLDGSGDLTFSRASDATRVQSDGLIEKVRTNLITYSNDFTNAAYQKITDGTYTITTETITDPFGNSVAVAKVTLTSGGFLVLRNLLASATNSPTTGSLYVKKTVAGTSIDIDLSDASSAVAANNTNWQRLVSTNPASVYGSGTFLDIAISTLNQPVYIAYAQIELSDFGATDYIATTSAAVSVGPVSGLPRLDYLNSTCPRLLLEPQRTNVHLNSENFATSSGISGGDITSNVETSPDGYMNADRLQGNGSTSVVQVFNDITIAASTIYTFSVFAKAGNANFLQLACTNMDTDTIAVFDLSLGTITLTGASSSPTITNYGNGWYRCSIQMVAQTTDLSGRFRIYMTSDGSGGIWPDANGKNLFLYGRQLEAGAYATSYIPTLSTSVTRVAENNVQVNPSTLVGATAGSWFIDVADYEFAIKGTTLGTTWIGDAESNNIGFVARTVGFDGIIFAKRESSTSTIIYNTASKTLKACFTWNGSSLKLFVDGVKVYDNNSFANFAAWDTFQLNYATREAQYNLNQTLLFPTQISDADAIALTA